MRNYLWAPLLVVGWLLAGVCAEPSALRADEPATSAVSASPPATPAEIPAYKDLSLPFEKRCADLVDRLTLEEKAAQLQIQIPANARLGIPACDWWVEASHGVSRAGTATVYPHAIALAATWDPALIQRVASATADELRAKYNPGQRNYGLTPWAPCVNLCRDPRWGRIMECYGEDPHLAARIGVAYCKGLQGDDPKYLKTIATPKHFALHSQETGRFSSSFNASERVLRDYYLPAFHACFTEGGALSTMCAFSGINKVPCTANSWLLNDLLRHEWNFQGAVVTDWTALSQLQHGHNLFPNPNEASAGAINAGVDILCEDHSYASHIVAAVQGKILPEEAVKHAVYRSLYVRFRLGLFDPPEKVPFTRIPPTVIGCKENLALALQSARESIVLLQNNPAPRGFGFERLLPLDLRRINTLAVLGPYASVLQFGNYSGQPANPPITPLGGLQAALGDRIRILTADWEKVEDSVQAAQAADVVVVILGLNDRMEGEGFDRKTIELPVKQSKFLKNILEANPITVLVLEGGGPIALNTLRAQIPAIVTIWYPGEQGGSALAEVLLGQYNPAGRLPLTVYSNLDDIGPLNEYEIDTGRTYLYFEKPVDYPFGHGLSYTTFAYSDLRLDPVTAAAGDKVVLTCSVTNTGNRAGDEVVQLYVHKTESSLKRPLKQLKAFTRISIPAGASSPVRFELPVQDLAFWDVAAHKYVVEPGTYEVMVGASSSDLRLRATLTVK